MSGGGIETTIQGIVRGGSLDAVRLSHRVSIVGTDGHVYEVEPSYVGRYLQRLEGHEVIARVELLLRGRKCSVVRISSLRLVAGTPAHTNGMNDRAALPPGAGPLEEGSCEVDRGGVGS